MRLLSATCMLIAYILNSKLKKVKSDAVVLKKNQSTYITAL